MRHNSMDKIRLDIGTVPTDAEETQEYSHKRNTRHEHVDSVLLIRTL